MISAADAAEIRETATMLLTKKRFMTDPLLTDAAGRLVWGIRNALSFANGGRSATTPQQRNGKCSALPPRRPSGQRRGRWRRILSSSAAPIEPAGADVVRDVRGDGQRRLIRMQQEVILRLRRSAPSG